MTQEGEFRINCKQQVDLRLSRVKWIDPYIRSLSKLHEHTHSQSGAYLLGYLIMTIWSGEGYTSRTPARFVPMQQQRPFRDKLSSQEGLRLPYICESMWKRWMGLQQFWWRWRRKDDDGFLLFLPSFFFPSPIMYAHTHVWPRYAKSLNMAVKRRRRVCQYGEYGRLGSLLLFLSSLQPIENRNINANIFTCHNIFKSTATYWLITLQLF